MTPESNEKESRREAIKRCPIRSRGDRALFGGHSTQEMKSRLGVPDSRPLADFLPTITIKAKDFANEITNFNIKRDDLATERAIADEHVKNNTDVRKLLTDRNIVPETLPPAEDVKKVERRLAAETKKLAAPTKAKSTKRAPKAASKPAPKKATDSKKGPGKKS